VNPNTVARAYTELEREGVLYTRPGLGVFVAQASEPLTKKVRRQKLLKTLDQLLVTAVRLGFGTDELIEFIQERTAEFQWNQAASRTN
jgi:GntR family transcriptional regulator